MVKFTGTTVEQAVSTGLQELNLTKEQVEITVITTPKKGFLGIGKKLAVVDLTPLTSNFTIHAVRSTETPESGENKTTGQSDDMVSLADNSQTAIRDLTAYLETIISEMGETATVTVTEKKHHILYNIETSNPGLVIGKHGKVLNAIQYLAQVYIHRTATKKLTVVVDVGDYRLRREEKLNRIAKQTVREVQKLRQPVFLDPMPAFERKQIHGLLSKVDNIVTHSEGEEPFRYLVVDYKKENTF